MEDKKEFCSEVSALKPGDEVITQEGGEGIIEYITQPYGTKHFMVRLYQDDKRVHQYWEGELKLKGE